MSLAQMMKKMATNLQPITPELLFLKYKGLPSPWEFIEQAKRFGYKCKKYANWSDVHVSEKSRQLLKDVGDSLIDSNELDLSNFSELSRIWERVQRWTKDKEDYSVEPDLFPEFEKIVRLIDVGSKKPDVVDLKIEEYGIDSESLSLDDRWNIFLAICICSFFQSSKRYLFLFEGKDEIALSKLKPKELIEVVRDLVVGLYLQVGFDISANDERQVISLFVKEIGCTDEPINTERSSAGKVRNLPKVYVEKFEGTQSELVKFQYADGNVIVKLNQNNKIYQSNSTLATLIKEEEYWTLIGNALLSHANHIDEIQDFFDTFAKQLRLRG
jgi:hypothetical protein